MFGSGKEIGLALGSAFLLLFMLWPIGVLVGAPKDPFWVVAFLFGVPSDYGLMIAVTVVLIGGVVLWQVGSHKRIPWGERLGYVWLYQLSGVMLLLLWIASYVRLLVAVYFALGEASINTSAIPYTNGLSVCLALLVVVVTMIWLARPVLNVSLLWLRYRNQAGERRGGLRPGSSLTKECNPHGTMLGLARLGGWILMVLSVVIWAVFFLTHQRESWIEIPKLLYLISIVTQLQMRCVEEQRGILLSEMPVPTGAEVEGMIVE